MGDDHSEDDEQPAHVVRIGPFYMDVCEVTPGSVPNDDGPKPVEVGRSTARPINSMSWYAAVQVCNMRSTREGLKPCYDLETLQCDFAAGGYRLPTEAEWELPAGREPPLATPSATTRCAGQLHWFKNSNGTTHPVKQKQPNPWGLCDMHGNLAEWCNDLYGESYEADGTRPNRFESGEDRVLRGGSWKTSEESCRSSARNCEAPRPGRRLLRIRILGFRCVQSAGNEGQAPSEHVRGNTPVKADTSRDHSQSEEWPMWRSCKLFRRSVCGPWLWRAEPRFGQPAGPGPAVEPFTYLYDAPQRRDPAPSGEWPLRKSGWSRLEEDDTAHRFAGCAVL